MSGYFENFFWANCRTNLMRNSRRISRRNFERNSWKNPWKINAWATFQSTLGRVFELTPEKLPGEFLVKLSCKQLEELPMKHLQDSWRNCLRSFWKQIYRNFQINFLKELMKKLQETFWKIEKWIFQINSKSISQENSYRKPYMLNKTPKAFCKDFQNTLLDKFSKEISEVLPKVLGEVSDGTSSGVWKKI